MDETKLITPENLIQWLPFIKDIPAEEISPLLQAFRPRNFPAGAILFHEGDVGDRLYLVIQGDVEIITFLGKEEERRLSYLKAGDIFGEMSLLVPGRLRNASARTTSPVVLLEMLHSDFETLTLRQPHLGFHILQEITVRLNATEQGIIDRKSVV